MLRTTVIALVVLVPLTANAGNSSYGGYGNYGRHEEGQSTSSGSSGTTAAPSSGGGWLGAIGDFFRDLYDAWNSGERQNAPPSDCISCGTRGDVDPALITRQYGAPVA
jgi:hypothetical protein